MPIKDSYLRQILITDNDNTKTLDVVNMIIFKTLNGEQAVTTKDLLSINVTKISI